MARSRLGRISGKICSAAGLKDFGHSLMSSLLGTAHPITDPGKARRRVVSAHHNRMTTSAVLYYMEGLSANADRQDTDHFPNRPGGGAGSRPRNGLQGDECK